MKVICNQSELMNALNIALRAVPSKTSYPVLECFFLKADEEQLVITTNDMEIGIETRLTCRVDTPGKIAINARIFSDIVRKLPEDIVFLETDKDYIMMITCGKAKFKISGTSGEDFPPLPDYEKTNVVKMSQYTLKEMISKTIFAISANENNAIMTGECFEVEGDKLRITALDGHRIAIRNIQLKAEADKCQVIIPGKTLNEISKIMSGNIDDEVCICFMDRQVIFEFGTTVVVSRLIEGKYYNVNPMINSSYLTKVIVNKKDFTDCIDRAILLVKESEKRPVIIDIRDGVMSFNMNSSIGTMDEDITAMKEGNDLTIGFNPKFLMDALRAVEDEDITLYLTTAKQPCFLRDAEDNYIYLILPVNFVGR
ncbi:MAG: DNA polymerase III subunit beta [Lachnospiraceae bacterium]|nr:DNA polymerase III subunit beta [Lachnospiraceae bacterium]